MGGAWRLSLPQHLSVEGRLLSLGRGLRRQRCRGVAWGRKGSVGWRAAERCGVGGALGRLAAHWARTGCC